VPADVWAVMAAIGSALETIDGLRVYPYPADAVSAPAAIVGLPEPVEFDVTLARGADRLTIPVWVLSARVVDRVSAETVAGYMSGTGAGSVKAAIEADPTLDGSAQSVRVTSAEPVEVTVAAVDLLAATFQVEVIA